MNRITSERIAQLRNENHTVFVMPRKRVVIVDGYKRYSITRRELKKVEA